MSLREGEERRRSERVPLQLSGRYMLEDGGEHRCQTQYVSLSGILLRGFPAGEVGERVVAYLDHLGRVEGTVVRGKDTWFAFEIAAPPAKMQKLATRIESLAAAAKALSNSGLS
jgi:hypothetical protein